MNITLRPAIHADIEFLFNLQKTTMREYVEPLFGAWDDEWQRNRFAETFAPEYTRVIMVDGKDAGWIVAEPRDDEVFLSKIMLLPAFQNQGIGAKLLRDLIAESHAAGKPVRLRVLKGNPAKALYERLGFTVIEEQDIRYIMQCDVPN